VRKELFASTTSRRKSSGGGKKSGGGFYYPREVGGGEEERDGNQTFTSEFGAKHWWKKKGMITGTRLCAKETPPKTLTMAAKKKKYFK